MTEAKPLLQVRDLTVTYTRRQRPFGRVRQTLRAVDGVNLDVGVGESVGLVGESGSGKSTIAQAVERLVPIESGSVTLDGEDLGGLKGRRLRALRRSVQMVFQDPYSSLDPSMSIGSSLEEPLKVHRIGRGQPTRPRLVEAMEAVGLRVTDLDKYPYEFSGGQRQRIAIARALICEPKLVVLDEAVSALDVSTRAQVLQLLQDLRQARGLAYLFIGHDLAVVRRMSDRIAVMFLGRIVESGPADRVVQRPAHPYTAALLASVPDARRRSRPERKALVTRGDPPDPWNRPRGCAFASRCPFAMPVCTVEEPPVVQVEGGGSATCHLHTSGPVLQGKSVNEFAPTPL
jgi:peptide/nickel transport system ATP-binding protein